MRSPVTNGNPVNNITNGRPLAQDPYFDNQNGWIYPQQQQQQQQLYQRQQYQRQQQQQYHSHQQQQHFRPQPVNIVPTVYPGTNTLKLLLCNWQHGKTSMHFLLELDPINIEQMERNRFARTNAAVLFRKEVLKSFSQMSLDFPSTVVVIVAAASRTRTVQKRRPTNVAGAAVAGSGWSRRRSPPPTRATTFYFGPLEFHQTAHTTPGVIFDSKMTICISWRNLVVWSITWLKKWTVILWTNPSITSRFRPLVKHDRAMSLAFLSRRRRQPLVTFTITWWWRNVK